VLVLGIEAEFLNDASKFVGWRDGGSVRRLIALACVINSTRVKKGKEEIRCVQQGKAAESLIESPGSTHSSST